MSIENNERAAAIEAIKTLLAIGNDTFHADWKKESDNYIQISEVGRKAIADFLGGDERVNDLLFELGEAITSKEQEKIDKTAKKNAEASIRRRAALKTKIHHLATMRTLREDVMKAVKPLGLPKHTQSGSKWHRVYTKGIKVIKVNSSGDNVSAGSNWTPEHETMAAQVAVRIYAGSCYPRYEKDQEKIEEGLKDGASRVYGMVDEVTKALDEAGMVYQIRFEEWVWKRGADKKFPNGKVASNLRYDQHAQILVYGYKPTRIVKDKEHSNFVQLTKTPWGPVVVDYPNRVTIIADDKDDAEKKANEWLEENGLAGRPNSGYVWNEKGLIE